MKYLPLVAWVFGLLASSCFAQEVVPGAQAIPMKPLPAAPYLGWPDALTLDNGTLRVVVVPAINRIVHIGLTGGDNLLHLNTNLVGRVPPAESEPWQNYGGDWIWPVSQERWKAVTGSDWPPPPFLNDVKGTGHAWRSDDDSLNARMEVTYPSPLHVRVTRQLRLAPTGNRLIISQRIERTEASTLPVCLWQISQVARPERVLLPTGPDSGFPEGYVSLFAPPAKGTVRRDGDVLVVDTATGGEFKLGTDSPRGWIAAEVQGHLLLEQTRATEADGAYPDGGCTTEVYSNTGRGYGEIESLTPEAQLAPGDDLERVITVSIQAIPGPGEPGLAQLIRETVGESDKPAERETAEAE